MMFAATGMGTCMAVVAGTSSQPSNVAAVGVAGAFIFLFSLFFPTGFLGLTFLYASEISPLSARVPITSMSTGTAWLFNFLVGMVCIAVTFRLLTIIRWQRLLLLASQRLAGVTTLSSHVSTTSSSFHVRVHSTYSVISTNVAAGVYLFYPETNGRHLEEVDQIFRDSKNILEPVKVARRLPVHTSADPEGPTGKLTSDRTEETNGR